MRLPRGPFLLQHLSFSLPGKRHRDFAIASHQCESAKREFITAHSNSCLHSRCKVLLLGTTPYTEVQRNITFQHHGGHDRDQFLCCGQCLQKARYR